MLQRALGCAEVIDGVIFGANVRLLLRESGKFPDLRQLNAGTDASIVLVPLRFEDDFIDILGGTIGGDSALTAIMPPIEFNFASDVVIEARALTKSFGSFVAVDNINFKVRRGEIFGLLGPNGAGKSTTFKMMCGLLAPSIGTAAVMGLDLAQSASAARQHIGYMAQKFSLYGDLTVRQNLYFFSGIYGLSAKIQVERINSMIEAFDLSGFLNTQAKQLALGFKQRLALACAIMHEPAILFLDEPTSGVDPITRREFWAHINGMVAKGVTIMVTTHYMDEAEYCDRIDLVYRSKLIELGTPAQLKHAAISQNQAVVSMEDAFIALLIKHDQQNPIVNATRAHNADINALADNLSIMSFVFSNQKVLI